MRVCVVGGSGVVGARLCARLIKQGFMVTSVVFRPDSQIALSRLGAESHRGDVREKATLFDAIEGSDLVVNCTASVPVDPARDGFCFDTQSKGMPNVAQVCKVMQVAHLITVSLLTAGQPLDGSPFAEKSPDPAVSSPALDGENSASSILADSSTRHTVVRLGQVYSGDSHWCTVFAEKLHASHVVVIGDGFNVRPLIHAEDACDSILAVAYEAISSLKVNAANNNKRYHVFGESITHAQFAAQFATAIGAPMPKKTPALLARMHVTETEHEELTRSVISECALFHRVYPQVKFQFPTFATGIGQIRNFWAALPQTRDLIRN